MNKQIARALEQRFGVLTEDIDTPSKGSDALAAMASRGSCRSFTPDPIPTGTLRFLCAIALSAPTKSDLQQRDIVLISDPERRSQVKALLRDQAWIEGAPSIVIFCGNNRRQRQIHEWHKRTFANDHFDAVFNAAVDAGIAMSAFITAADLMGLGTCPISAVRNRASDISTLLGLPNHVFPAVGLAVGHPTSSTPQISMRLPLSATVHENTFSEDGIRQAVADYDQRRAEGQPYTTQRFQDEFGTAALYTWSDDKTRQYSKPERADFGQYIRDIGFKLD